MEYSMKVYPIYFDDGRTEWCVEYPDLKVCVGGGDTVEEAIKDAEKYKLYIKNTQKMKCLMQLFYEQKKHINENINAVKNENFLFYMFKL